MSAFADSVQEDALLRYGSFSAKYFLTAVAVWAELICFAKRSTEGAVVRVDGADVLLAWLRAVFSICTWKTEMAVERLADKSAIRSVAPGFACPTVGALLDAEIGTDEIAEVAGANSRDAVIIRLAGVPCATGPLAGGEAVVGVRVDGFRR